MTGRLGLMLAVGIVLAGLAACGTKGDPVPPQAAEARPEEERRRGESA